MPESDKKTKDPADKKAPENRDITFKCKFCGETRPISELIVMRHYHPQMAACKACSRSIKTQSNQDSLSS